MKSNITMRRVATRIGELFNGQIDMSDIQNDSSNHFETRALSALVLVMQSGIEISKACVHITDGYHDMGLDAIYLDEAQRKLFIVQSKWRSNGTGGIDQEEMLSFTEGIK